MSSSSVRASVLAILLAVAAGLVLWWVLAGRGEPTVDSPAAGRDAPAEVTGPTLEGGGVRPAPSPPPVPEAPPQEPRAAIAPAAPGTGARLLVEVRGKDKRPIEGARVRVVPKGDLPELAGTTDVNGALRLEGLGAPAAVVFVEAVGFVSEQTELNILQEGEECHTTLTLEPGAVLEGRVVEAATGRPIAGARIRSRGGGTVGSSSYSGGEESYGEARSDAEGRWKLSSLPLEWAVTIWAELEGWSRGERAVLFMPPAEAREPLVLALTRAGWVVAHVRGPDGEPVKGATVEAVREGAGTDAHDQVPREGTCAETSDDAAVYRGVTDASGTCSVAGLPFDVKFCLFARAPGLARSLPVHGVVTSEREPTARVDLRLRKPAHVRILCRDAQDKPLAGIETTLDPDPGDRTTNLHPDEGRIDLPDLVPGALRLTLTREGLLPVVLDLTLAEGESVERTVRFDEGVRIEGLVVDEQGVPLAGARVQALKAGQHRGSAASDAQGRFAIAGLAAGEYGLKAVAGGVTFHSEDHNEPQVTVTAPSAGARLVVRRQARLTVELKVPVGGAPPEDVMLWTEDRKSRNSHGNSVEWKEGRIEWVFSAGTYRLSFTSRNYAPFVHESEFTPGQVVDLGVVTLDVGVRLEGRVVDVEGRPVARVTVSIGNAQALTGQDGRFALEHLARDKVTVYVGGEDFVSTHEALDLARSTPFLTLTLRRGGVVVGQVKTAAGGAGGGLSIRAVPLEPLTPGQLQGWDQTDVDGRFRLRLAPGRYRVEVRNADETLLASAEAALAEGQDLPFELKVP